MKNNKASSRGKKFPIGILIWVVIIGTVVISMYVNNVNDEKLNEAYHRKKIIVSLACHKYLEMEVTNPSKAEELLDQIKSYDVMVAESDILELAEKGQELSGTQLLADIREDCLKKYNELIRAVENDKMHKVDYRTKEELKLVEEIGLVDLQDLSTLLAYVEVEQAFSEGNDILLASHLVDIPDNYSGVLSSKILTRKQELVDQCESYQLLKRLEAFTKIELLACKWYKDGNYVKFKGKVKNGLEIPISYVKVEIVYEDDNNNILDSDWTYAVGSHPLQSGYVKSFDLMTPHTAGMEVAKWEVVSFVPAD